MRLVHNDGYNDRGTQSLYHHKRANMSSGIRSRQTYTMTAIGTCVPILIIVSGLTEAEMPNLSFIWLEVEGLCPGSNGSALKVREPVTYYLREVEMVMKLGNSTYISQ